MAAAVEWVRAREAHDWFMQGQVSGFNGVSQRVLDFAGERLIWAVKNLCGGGIVCGAGKGKGRAERARRKGGRGIGKRQ